MLEVSLVKVPHKKKVLLPSLTALVYMSEVRLQGGINVVKKSFVINYAIDFGRELDGNWTKAEAEDLWEERKRVDKGDRLYTNINLSGHCSCV